jgi:O-antigen/teichoic acid export membrane protein
VAERSTSGGESPRSQRGAILRRLFQNAALLLSGNLGASALGLASIVLTARALGVEQFGVLVLITTYVLIVDRLVNFQSWQAVIKYGTNALEDDQAEEFKSLIKFGFVLDVTTATVGTVLAASAVWLVGQWQEWDKPYVLMAVAYSLTILFHIAGTPTAVLRIFDRFGRVAAQNLAAAAIKLLGVTIATVLDAGIWAFLSVWAVSDVLGRLLLIQFALKELQYRDIRRISRSSMSSLSARFPGIWGFVWTTNLHSSVKLGLREADVMVVGSFLGAAGVGLYKIVKSIGSTLGKFTDPLYQAVYPDLARSAGARTWDTFKHLIFAPLKYVLLTGILLVAVFVLVGQQVIELLLGSEYSESFRPAVVYLAGTIIAMSTFSFHPAMLSLGKPHLSLGILITSTTFYLASLYFLTNAFGLEGASASYVLFYVLWASLQWFFIKKALTRKIM